MQMFAEGSIQTQAKFAEWRKLHQSLKFYIEQDFVFFSVDNDLARSKITMLNHSLNLIGQLIKTPSGISQIIQSINMLQLKSKLIDIFKFKIAGTPQRLYIYSTNLKCNHKELCGENYCFFEHLVEFDKITIQCAHGIFYILLMANKLLPEDLLGNIRFNPKYNYLNIKNKKRFLPELNWEAFHRV